ncbi:MAG TPA: tetratricopeptide repeat protein [Xanthobacteraceae bacterium]|nr:tetratricopeptide repeat protein [Xanthobacteraceae bacterium]
MRSAPRTKQTIDSRAWTITEALTLHRQGRLAEAEQRYMRILTGNPRDFDALHLLGVLKLQRGDAEEALRLVGAAIAIDPRSADALSNYAAVLQALGRKADALASYERALAIDPNHIDALYNRGLALQESERFAEALACYDAVLVRRPDHVHALNNRGVALHRLGRNDEALAAFDRALAVAPDFVEALSNRGNLLQDCDRDEEALASLDKALAIEPDHLGALTNRGSALVRLGRPADAVRSLEAALAIRPDFAEARLNCAIAQLMLGDFRAGWANYEWRTRTRRLSALARPFDRPQWDGTQAVAGRTILLHAEQGLGDTIHFVRYAPLLVQRGAKVLLEVQAPLVPLLAGLQGVVHVFPRGEALPDFDLHSPLMSLPHAFRTELATIPAEVPYLSAPPVHIEMWRERLGRTAAPRVGLAWLGSAHHRDDRNRSIALERLAPLLATPGIRYVSLQKELRPGDRERLAALPQIDPLGETFGDFADTAAVVAQLDLIISVDTAVAHLAGAMAKPVWILLPAYPDFRWLLGREDSPWYRTARLFRQPRLGDWESVISCLGEALLRWAGVGPTPLTKS